MANNISAWFTTDSGNNTGSAPNFPVEQQSPSSVNDTMRTIYGAVARWYQDTNGTLATTGTANTRALTTNNAHAALADQSLLVFRSNLTNTGAATLNVDGLGAKSMRVGGAALVGGELVADAIVAAVYNATDDAYDILGGTDLGLGPTDDVAFNSIKVGGTGGTELREYTGSDTDVTALVPGSTLGSLLEAAPVGHCVIGIRGNDGGDGFHIIDTNNGGNVAYARWLLSMKPGGLELIVPLAVAQGGTGSASGVDTAIIVNNAVTNAKLADMPQLTVKGRGAGVTGDPVDLTAAQLVDVIETADGVGSGLDADLLDGQQGSFYQSASNLNAGELANARVAQSNVTQHQAALSIAATQVGGGVVKTHTGTGGSITVSTSAASGAASNGDIWMQV